MIERVINAGAGLVSAKHFAADDIQRRMDELSNDWDDLMRQAANRRNKLDASLAKHKVKALHSMLLTDLFRKESMYCLYS